MGFGKLSVELFEDISQQFENLCIGVDEAVNCKLLAVSDHIKGLWTEVVQDINCSQSIVDVKDEKVPTLPDSQTLTAIVDDENKNIDTCPIHKSKIIVPENHLQIGSPLEQNAPTGVSDKSNAGCHKDCTDGAEFPSLGSLESKTDSTYFERVDINNGVASDQQPANSIASSELSESSFRTVVSDDALSILSTGEPHDGTEEIIDLDDYAEENKITHIQSTTVGSRSLVFKRKVMKNSRSQHTKPELSQDFVLVNSRALEKHKERSNIKSVEAQETERIGAEQNQKQERSLDMTLPNVDSVSWEDDIFSEADWVIV